MERIYRVLIVFTTIAYLVWFFQPYNSDIFYSEGVAQLLRSDGFGGADILLRYSVELGWLLLSLYLVSAVGMFYFIRAARTLFLYLIVASLLLKLFLGVSVQSNIDYFLIQLTMMVDGIILYMSYFSSVAKRYQTQNNRLQSDSSREVRRG